MLMKRTQIYIDIPTYRQAKAVAQASGKTISELIRTSLVRSLRTETTDNPLENILLLSKKIRFPKSTPKNLSTSLDRALYPIK